MEKLKNIYVHVERPKVCCGQSKIWVLNYERANQPELCVSISISMPERNYNSNITNGITNLHKPKHNVLSSTLLFFFRFTQIDTGRSSQSSSSLCPELCSTALLTSACHCDHVAVLKLADFFFFFLMWMSSMAQSINSLRIRTVSYTFISLKIPAFSDMY